MSRQQILNELHADGFRADGSYDDLPRQHLMFFRVDEGS
jgi:hypothetical protein